MVDPERLHRILRRVTDDLATLEGYAQDPAGTRTDAARPGHTKYLFVIATLGRLGDLRAYVRALAPLLTEDPPRPA